MHSKRNTHTHTMPNTGSYVHKSAKIFRADAINKSTNRSKPIRQSSFDCTIIENVSSMPMIFELPFLVLNCWDLKGIVFCYYYENRRMIRKELVIYTRMRRFFLLLLVGHNKANSNLICEWFLYPFSNFLPNLD